MGGEVGCALGQPLSLHHPGVRGSFRALAACHGSAVRVASGEPGDAPQKVDFGDGPLGKRRGFLGFSLAPSCEPRGNEPPGPPNCPLFLALSPFFAAQMPEKQRGGLSRARRFTEQQLCRGVDAHAHGRAAGTLGPGGELGSS